MPALVTRGYAADKLQVEKEKEKKMDMLAKSKPVLKCKIVCECVCVCVRVCLNVNARTHSNIHPRSHTHEQGSEVTAAFSFSRAEEGGQRVASQDVAAPLRRPDLAIQPGDERILYTTQRPYT